MYELETTSGRTLLKSNQSIEKLNNHSTSLFSNAYRDNFKHKLLSQAVHYHCHNLLYILKDSSENISKRKATLRRFKSGKTHFSLINLAHR